MEQSFKADGVAERLSRGEVVHLDLVLSDIDEPTYQALRSGYINAQGYRVRYRQGGYYNNYRRDFIEYGNEVSERLLHEGREDYLEHIKSTYLPGIRSMDPSISDTPELVVGIFQRLMDLNARKLIVEAYGHVQTPEQWSTLTGEVMTWVESKPNFVAIPGQLERSSATLLDSVHRQLIPMLDKFKDEDSFYDFVDGYADIINGLDRYRQAAIDSLFRAAGSHIELTPFLLSLAKNEVIRSKLLLHKTELGFDAPGRAFAILLSEGSGAEQEFAEKAKPFKVAEVTESAMRVIRQNLVRIAPQRMIERIDEASYDQTTGRQTPWSVKSIISIANMLAKQLNSTHPDGPQLQQLGHNAFNLAPAFSYILEALRVSTYDQSKAEAIETAYEALPFLAMCDEIVRVKSGKSVTTVGDMVIKLVERGLSDEEISNRLNGAIQRVYRHDMHPEYEANRRRAGRNYAYFKARESGSGLIT